MLVTAESSLCRSLDPNQVTSLPFWPWADTISVIGRRSSESTKVPLSPHVTLLIVIVIVELSYVDLLLVLSLFTVRV